ncbi:hypothetical protein ACH51_00785 [Ralstonia solanacearum]|nr:hypothetical protein ACH51_00785 [Ralstonia solanacearum]
MTVLMTPDMANFSGNVHGGHILKLLDQVAYACASVQLDQALTAERGFLFQQLQTRTERNQFRCEVDLPNFVHDAGMTHGTAPACFLLPIRIPEPGGKTRPQSAQLICSTA